jgi:hypothetical protein
VEVCQSLGARVEERRREPLADRSIKRSHTAERLAIFRLLPLFGVDGGVIYTTSMTRKRSRIFADLDGVD